MANSLQIVDKFAATLDRDNEIQIGVDASFTMMDDACVPELLKVTTDLLINALTS